MTPTRPHSQTPLSPRGRGAGGEGAIPQRDFAKTLRQHMTDAEHLLWRHLRGHRLAGTKFKRQQPIGPYVVDFAHFGARLIVEADGGQHNESAAGARRDAWLMAQGFRVMRFWNNDILGNTEAVLESVIGALENPAPSPPALPPRGGRGGQAEAPLPLWERGWGEGGSKERGFTLVEMIMVIVITGIIAGMVAVFIARPVQGYTDSARRAVLTDAADTTLRQIAREIRLALPNSLRVNCTGGWCYIEFIPTSDGGRYRDAGDGSTGGNFLDFADSTKKDFDVLGPMVNAAANDYVVVYNLGPDYEPANAYVRGQAECDATPVSPGCNIAQIASISGTNTIVLTENVFAAQTPPLPSPNARFQVVPNSTQAVTFACPTSAGAMTRYWGYGFNTVQPTAFLSGSSALVLNNVTCTAEYTPNVLQRNGLLYLKLTVSSEGEAVEVFDQIHVDNSP